MRNVESKTKMIPIPGIEPGPPGWEPGILTTRPYRIVEYTCEKIKYKFVRYAIEFVKLLVRDTELRG